MSTIVQQVAGIDVAKDELVVSFSQKTADGIIEHVSSKVFKNHPKGFQELLLWSGKLFDAALPVSFVMEATGVYHEALAYFLDEACCKVCIILPNKISNYFKTLEIKTINDKTSAQTIARFALERKLEYWVKPSPVFRTLKQLCREREQLVAQRSLIKNQLHAEKTQGFPNEASIRRMKERIGLFNKQEQQIKHELMRLIAADPVVKQQIENICSIRGVGILTAITVLAETNGFELIRNKKQLVSYCGLDVQEKQSGTSVKGKPKLSKKGNRNLRKTMHFPALTAIRHDERMKAVFIRLVSRHGIKMKAIAAVQRKLLDLIYIIWKTGRKYDPEYLQKQAAVQLELEQPL
ncbi:MAG: IS110 family transposase [Bacteroidota bacterium]|nr:IS110 family transposase [Bacteroidota bacterium]